MDKKEMRKGMLARLKQMDEQEFSRKSLAIHERLWEDADFQKAKTVGVTVSAPPEVDTWQLIERMWEAGKQVVVPKCEAKTRRMDFRLLTDFAQLETVYMGLKEPIESETEYTAPEDIDLLLVPGVVYSRSGFRIGFGGGYYDRYLVHYKGATRSLAFDMQITDAVPVEPHDLPVGGIYTESSFIDTKKVER